MRLNRSTDIGLRILMLAAARADDLFTVDTLASAVMRPSATFNAVIDGLRG